jgi:Ribonuclease toxin, BrnT, of type II toxin-antitoxin system
MSLIAVDPCGPEDLGAAVDASRELTHVGRRIRTRCPDVCVYVQRRYTVRVAALRFEWDERKNRANWRKHGVSFEEAKTAFADEHGLLIDDPAHSEAKTASFCSA